MRLLFSTKTYLIVPILVVLLITKTMQSQHGDNHNIDMSVFNEKLHELKQQHFFENYFNDIFNEANIPSNEQYAYQRFIADFSEQDADKMYALQINKQVTTEDIKALLNALKPKYIGALYKYQLKKNDYINLLPPITTAGNGKKINPTTQTAGQPCTNMDFSSGDTTGWTGSWGQQICGGTVIMNTCYAPMLGAMNDPYYYSGFNLAPNNTPVTDPDPKNHCIMTSGFDAVLPFIPVNPPTGGNSMRLGNLNVYPNIVGNTINLFKATSIKQTFLVTNSNKNFIYQYAIVLEDPGHATNDQPYFKVRMYDQSGQIISCASLDINATNAPLIGGFDTANVTFNYATRHLVYRNWTPVLIPLNGYVGTNVTIEFITSDCKLGAHGGYAYVSSYCAPQQMNFSGAVCSGSNSYLHAPLGAANYSWAGPGIVAHGDSSTVTINQAGSYSVTMTTFLTPPQTVPCVFTIDTIITSSPLSANANFTNNIVCLGTTGASITFTDLSTPTGSVSGWEWDFENDGTNDETSPNPIHTFTTAGVHHVKLKVTRASCTSDTIIDITISQPSASFTYTNACLNTSSNFAVNTTTASNSNYNWNWGDASANSTGSLTAHTFTASGTYSVILTGTTVVGNCVASSTQTITIDPSPTASFSSLASCQPFTSFTDLSTTTGAITSWAWDFTNDGTVDSSLPNPTYTFSSLGNYTTQLTVTNNKGCSNSFTLPVVSSLSPSVTLFSNPVCFGITTSFTALVTPSNTSTTYTYNFGDGGQTMLQNPIHLYTTASNATINTIYNVTVTANTNGCISTATLPVTVYALPQASYSFTPVCFNTATPLISTSNGNGNPITNYSWDFTNDNNADLNGPSNLNFTFANIGNNPVTLTITTTPTVGLTCQSFITQNVIVLSNPTAAFTFTNACVNAPSHTFDGSSSSTAVGTLTNYAWSFGDAQTTNSLTANTSHTYNTANFYNVTLTVTTSNGCTNSTSKQIEVYPKPSSNITSSNACLGIATSFSATTLEGNITTWQWDINNSITSLEVTGQQSLFLFPSSGSHTLHLITTTTNNCKDTTAHIITVYTIPTVSFSVNDPDGCSEHCVIFTNLTTAMVSPESITNWTWNFDNGKILNASTNSNQSTCYENNSSSVLAYYSVTLTATSNMGCKATLVKPNYITVFPSPLADYNVNPDLGTVLAPQMDFTNLSKDFIKWYWSFGDGPTKDSSHLNPVHYYGGANTATSYYTTLTVVNEYGCIDVATKPIKIEPEFTFYIPNTFTPNKDGVNDFFTGMGIGITEYELWIFDRWGVSIYYTTNIEVPWDGSLQTNGNEAKQDVYTWKVKLKDVFNKTHEYVGHVTLLK